MEGAYDMDKETQIYTEVYMTLSRLNKDLINKIPEELKMTILEKADTSYPYNNKFYYWIICTTNI